MTSSPFWLFRLEVFVKFHERPVREIKFCNCFAILILNGHCVLILLITLPSTEFQF